MALDSRFVSSTSLQWPFVDKDTGTPLSGGIVTFYEDDSRTVLKPAYQLSGSPPYSSASFTELPNPCFLSSIGTFQDNNGNDIIPYFYPFTGTPADNTGVPELYYITVESSASTLQFTREAWPPGLSGSTPPDPGSSSFENFIPNGQFLIHNFPYLTTNVAYSTRNADISYIAQGGWTFEVPHGTSSTNAITFQQQLSPSTDPNKTSNPRYYTKVVCSVPAGGDSFKDLCIEFPDVNKFASSNTDNDSYKFAFEGFSNSGSSLTADVRLIKFFGTGGSPSTLTDVSLTNGLVTISTSNSIYEIPLDFGDNAGKTIGTNNDDWLKIVIRFPNTACDVSLTDFILANGDVDIISLGFPVTPNAEFLTNSLPGWLPTPNSDGSDLYLPPVLTPQGMRFDTTQIGKIYTTLSSTAEIGELLCDGTKYSTLGYSSDGIPYSRLQAKLMSQSSITNVPQFGTGGGYFTSYINNLSPANQIWITTNDSGAGITHAGSGTSGFALATIAGGASSYGVSASKNGSNSIIFRSFGIGTVGGSASVGGTGFAISNTVNNSDTYPTWVVTCSSGTVTTAAAYFRYVRDGGGDFYVWVTINGSGADPTPGGTGIKVDLLSTYTASDVASIICNALNACQVTTVIPLSGTATPQSSYFTLHNSSNAAYYVWYNKDGSGVDPAPSGTGIEVAITTGQTIAQVAAATQLAINSKYFAVPDLRGSFLRGWNDGRTQQNSDPDASSRFGGPINSFGDQIGNLELSTNISHSHTASFRTNLINLGSTGSPTFGSDSVTDQAVTVFEQGNVEARPLNISVNYVIKY